MDDVDFNYPLSNRTVQDDYNFFFGGMMNNVFDLVCKRPLDFNFMIVFLIIVSLLGIIGNTCLLLVICCNHRLRNAPNMLIINVAIADILYILTNSPFYIKHEFGRPCWGYSFVACQLRNYIPQVAQGVCVFSLTALSRERYVAIVKGLESRMIRGNRRTIITTSLAWVFGIIISIPVLFLSSTPLGGINCLYMPLRTNVSQAYMMFLFIVVYLIPLIFITIHYCHIARSLCKSTVTSIAKSSSGSAQQMKCRRKLAQVVLVITIFFGAFWFPHYVFYLWNFFTKHGRYIEENARFVRIFRYIDYYMALANSCINPWIVFVMSSVHRNTLRSLKTKFTCRRQMSVASGSMSSRFSRSTRLLDQQIVKSPESNSINIAVTKM